MLIFFECKVRYDKTMDTGMIRTVTESFLVDALSFTEAEARIVEEVQPFVSGGFGVVGVYRRRFSDSFFNETGDRYYKAKLNYITLDEKSGCEKRTAANMLVQASELKEAMTVVEKEMGKTTIDYTIVSIVETAIVDVFIYGKSGSMGPA